MNKHLGIATMCLALVLGLSACGSNSADKPADNTQGAPVNNAPTYRVITNSNSDFGGSNPSWVTKSTFQLEKSEEYADFYVFKLNRTGANLQAVKLMTSNADASAEIARYVSMRVSALFASSEVGDDKKLETYMENVVKNYTKTKLSTFRRSEEFWVQREYFADKRTEYAYYALYTVEKAQIRKLVADAVNAQPDSAEKTTAKERVKQVMEDNLPQLNEE